MAPPWLRLLREVHAAADAGVAAAVRERVRRGGRLACRRGCAACCRGQSDIAVYPLELAGLSWHCVERLAAPERSLVRARLAAHEPGGACPFLAGEACAVYPVRPMSCRWFNVFGVPCAEGEDPWHSRPEDVLKPRAEALDRAVRRMLPFHGVTSEADAEHWIARRLHHALLRNLKELDWRSLGKLMDAADARAASGGAPGRGAPDGP